MATYLSLVNSVLRKLREDEVTDVDDNTYSKLIGDFLNLVKEEVEDALNWNVLRTTIQVTTVADTYRYVLTSADGRSTLLDVFNDTEDMWVKEINHKSMTAYLSTSPVTKDSPMYYNLNGVDSSGDLQVDLWPVPDGVDVLNFNMVIPEDILSASTDTTNIPTRVLVLGAWALALSERGEDGGVPYSEADQKYRKALADAIAIDAAHHSYEYVMDVV